MKKFFFLFILLIGFKTANAQLEFYQFMFNIYDNGERTTDSRRFDIKLNVYERTNPKKILQSYTYQAGDTSKNLGYDYNILQAGGLFFEMTGEIIITKGTEQMKIILDNPKASAWTSIGFDRINFTPGTFIFDEAHWPQKVRIRLQNNRSFNYVDENFDWETIRK
ncbi:MAG: hypothetical protein JST55_17135 [Bacteroidetes bacterium]|nr:hypothetical protein [Bacteroidota bacterium]